MISVVINYFNMRREAARSLLALSRRYQRGIEHLDYEVIAVDNGSAEPLDVDFVRSFGPKFRHRFFKTSSPSPVEAINDAVVNDARGEYVMVMIDGAQILSPGVLNLTDKAVRAFDDPFVCATSFPLGIRKKDDPPGSYNQAVEDQQLAAAKWEEDGYRLFRLISSFGDDGYGWFGCFYESCCVCLKRSTWLEVGGFDVRFQSPGAGLASPDFFRRMVLREETDYVVLLGEATFHQFHGGVASNADLSQHPWQRFEEEYVRIRGEKFQRVARPPIYFGGFNADSIRVAELSAQQGLAWWRTSTDEARR